MHKAGFINIIGNPNVGKSTLMNALVGEKLSIITSKAQTTRHRIMGIVNGENFQIVYSDTPGIIKPHNKLHESMMHFVKSALIDADIFLFVVEMGEKNPNQDVIDAINKTALPVILIINKIDLSSQKLVEDYIKFWDNKLLNAEIIPVSALHKFNIERVFNEILAKLPVSPPYYSKDTLTDKSQRFFVSEIIRQKILLFYSKEIPYSVEVAVTSFKEEKTIIRISSTIYVGRESQKAIILGHQGKAIKKIGIESRKDLEELFDNKIYLGLTVKVSKDWRNDNNQLKRFGYDL